MESDSSQHILLFVRGYFPKEHHKQIFQGQILSDGRRSHTGRTFQRNRCFVLFSQGSRRPEATWRKQTLHKAFASSRTLANSKAWRKSDLPGRWTNAGIHMKTELRTDKHTSTISMHKAHHKRGKLILQRKREKIAQRMSSSWNPTHWREHETQAFWRKFPTSSALLPLAKKGTRKEKKAWQITNPRI